MQIFAEENVRFFVALLLTLTSFAVFACDLYLHYGKVLTRMRHIIRYLKFELRLFSFYNIASKQLHKASITYHL